MIGQLERTTEIDVHNKSAHGGVFRRVVNAEIEPSPKSEYHDNQRHDSDMQFAIHVRD
jgi:hypothetical protein